MKLSNLTEWSKGGEQTNVTRSKITTIVQSNDSDLEEALYSSISEVEKEMLANDQGNLSRQNKHLRQALLQLRGVLRNKLEGALRRNK